MKKILLTILLLAGGMLPGLAQAYIPYRPEIPERNFGDRKFLMILFNLPGNSNWAEFEQNGIDAREFMDNMMNEEGWVSDPLGASNVWIPGYYNGSVWIKPQKYWAPVVGSVRDFYIENSMGKFRPQFDVFGPVTIPSDLYDSGTEADYLSYCYDQLKSEINIDDYDTDGDGYVDCVIMARIGGGVCGVNTVGDVTLGNKKTHRLIRSDEYVVGGFCHELGHYLGMMDLYNPDPGNPTGNRDLPGKFCLMATGNSNFPRNTPPYLTTMERYYMGWKDGFETIDKPGTYTLSPLSTNDAYKIDTPNEGEFFIIEYRPFSRWDQFIDACGVFVYHVDQSQRVVDGLKAIDWWKQGKKTINVNNQEYPLYTVYHTDTEWMGWSFPGKFNRKEVDLTGGDGNYIGVSLKDIGFNGDQAWFRVVYQYMVKGSVSDAAGKPMEGVTVTLTAQDGRTLSAVSDASGAYKIALEEDDKGTTVVVSVSQQGYLPVSQSLMVNGVMTKCDVSLLKEGEGLTHTLQKFDETAESGRYGTFGQYGGTAAMRYSAAELSDAGLVGGRLLNISFYVGSQSTYTSNYYVVVYFGSNPVLVKDVTDSFVWDKWLTVDVQQDNVVIPSGQDVYIGYALKSNCPSDSGWWPNAMAWRGTNHGGGFYKEDVVGESINWPSWQRTNATAFEFAIRATVQEDVNGGGGNTPAGTTPSDFGIAWIGLDSQGEYLEVYPPAGKTVSKEEWDVIGNDEGYVCHLTYTDGSSEDVFYMFE